MKNLVGIGIKVGIFLILLSLSKYLFKENSLFSIYFVRLMMRKPMIPFFLPLISR